MPRKQSTKPTKEEAPIKALNDELEKKRHEFQEQISHNKPQKKQASRNKLMIGLALAVALLASLGIAAYVFWYQNPDRVVGDAIVRALDADTTNFTATYKLGNSVSIDATGGSAGAKGAKLSLTAKSNINDKQGAFATDVVMDQDGNVYLSGIGIENALGSALVSDASTPGSYANILQQKIEGKWLKINSEQMQPYSKKYASILSCVETVIKKIQTDQPLLKESADIYVSNRFLVVDKILGAKDGSTGYGVHVDQTKLKNFLTKFKNTTLYQDFHDCDSATFDLNVDTFPKRLDAYGLKSFELWINGNHDITSLVAQSQVGDNSSILTLLPQFNQEVKIIVPTTTVSLSQVHDYMTDGTQAMSLSKLTDTTSKQQYQALIDKLKATP